jgi:hypothetical protein
VDLLYGTTGKHKTVACDWVLMSEVIAVGSINKSNKLEMILGRWKGGEGLIKSQDIQGDSGQGRMWFWLPVDKAPADSIVEVFGKILEVKVMETSRRGGKFGKGGYSIANAGVICNICKEDFAKQGAVGEAHFFFQSGMFDGRFGRTSGKW